MRSVKAECLNRRIFLGEEHIRSSLSSFEEHYNRHRNHQGTENQLLTSQVLPILREDSVQESTGRVAQSLLSRSGMTVRLSMSAEFLDTTCSFALHAHGWK